MTDKSNKHENVNNPRQVVQQQPALQQSSESVGGSLAKSSREIFP